MQFYGISSSFLLLFLFFLLFLFLLSFWLCAENIDDGHQ